MKKIISFFVSSVLLVSIGRPVFSQNVLIIYDEINSNTNNLQSALTNAGMNVTMSNTPETSYNGNNPAPSAFDAIIHLNGTTYTVDMPLAGQDSIVNFVQNGGAYLQGEWNAYEYLNGRLQHMNDLILLNRTGGFNGTVTYTEVISQSSHPVLANVPPSFSFLSGFNVGNQKVYTSQPSTVLMKDGNNDAVLVRDFGCGRVVGFSHSGNYLNQATLSDPNVQQLYIDGILWAIQNILSIQDTVNSQVSCFGASDGSAELNVSGGVTPYSYLWSNGDTIALATGLPAGNYVVTVTDNNGCTNVDSVSVTEPPAIDVLNDSIVNLLCNGDSNGYAGIAVSGGIPPYTYLWSNGDTTQDLTDIPAGTYTVTVTDSVLCDTIATLTVNEPAAITLQFVTIHDTDSCAGSATVSVSGGLPPYTYQWDANANNQTGATATGLCVGTYCVTVSDSNGCTVDSCGIEVLVAVDVLTDKQGISIYPNPTSGMLSIVLRQSFKEGEIAIYNAIGKQMLSEKIRQKINVLDLGRLRAGAYFLRITIDGKVRLNTLLLRE